jgi:hypothetical protein
VLEPEDGVEAAVAMWMGRFAFAVTLSESVTSTLTVELTEVVATPEIVPVVEFTVRPAGIVAEVVDQVNGATPPLTANGAEYATPTCPAGSAVVVIWGGFPIVISRAFDEASESLFWTATDMIVSLAVNWDDIRAVSSVELTKVVGCATPFHVTTDSWLRFAPATTSTKLDAPAVIAFGEILDIRA